MSEKPEYACGSKTKCSPELIAKAVALLADGRTMEEAAGELGIKYWELAKYSRQFRELWQAERAKYPNLKRTDSGRPLATEGQRSELLESAALLDGSYKLSSGEVSRADWWRAFISASLDCKLQRKILLGLRFQQLAPNGTVVFNSYGEAVRKLSSSTLTLIKAIEGKRRRVFEFPADDASFARAWAKIARGAGIKGKLPRLNPRGRNAPRDTTIREFIPEGGTPQTLAALFETLYRPLRMVNRSPRTVDLYHTLIKQYSKWLGRDAMLSDLNDQTVCKFLAHLQEKRGTPAAGRKERDMLLAVWRFACQRRLVLFYPEVPKIVAPRRTPDAWTTDEVRRIFETIAELEGTYNGIRCRDWWAALLITIWLSGERISAVMSLSPADVDLERRWLTVRAELRKGKNSDMRSKIPDYAVPVLATVHDPKAERFLPWPYQFNYLWNRYGQILKRSGLPNGSRNKFHKLRRSVASYFEAAGGDATKMLGHSARSITEKHYLDERIVTRVHPADLLPNPMQPKPPLDLTTDHLAWL